MTVGEFHVGVGGYNTWCCSLVGVGGFHALIDGGGGCHTWCCALMGGCGWMPHFIRWVGATL